LSINITIFAALKFQLKNKMEATTKKTAKANAKDSKPETTVRKSKFTEFWEKCRLCEAFVVRLHIIIKNKVDSRISRRFRSLVARINADFKNNSQLSILN
jgi:hypothetical protein